MNKAPRYKEATQLGYKLCIYDDVIPYWASYLKGRILLSVRDNGESAFIEFQYRNARFKTKRFDFSNETVTDFENKINILIKNVATRQKKLIK